MAENVKVFVAWDSELVSVGLTFRAIRDEPEAGIEVEILGVAGDIAVGQLDRLFARGIDTSSALLAVIDTPNANVAWELGFAMAAGLRVALATEGKGGAAWVKGTPLDPVLRQKGVGKGTVARELLGSVASWAAPPRAPDPGGRKLLVCPDHGAGDEWRGSLRKRLGPEGWDLLDDTGWTLADLPRRLDSVDRVAWVVLPKVADEARHGVGNTIGALVAGYAERCGLSLAALTCEASVDIADARHRSLKFDGTPAGLAAAIRAWSASLDEPRVAHVSPLAAYRGRVHALHANPLRYVTRLGLRATDLVPVDLDVEVGGAIDRLEGPARAETSRSGLLRVLAEEDIAAGKPARWLVKAEPGAGKTTLMRQLAHALSAPEVTTVPVFVSLSEWEEHGGTIVEAALRQARGADSPDGDRVVVDALARLGRERGRVWIFLDGFDEVRQHDGMRERIQKLGGEAGGAVIVVTSRAGAVERGRAWEGFTAASLRTLTDRQQATLIGRLLGGDATAIAAFERDMGERPGIAMLLRNPFLLTLAVGIHARARERDEKVPVDRVALLVRALDDCLARGWAEREIAEERRRRWSARGARHVLRALSLELHRRGGEGWSRDVIADVLNELGDSYRKARAVFGHDGTIWRSDTEFLDDVKFYAGVLGPLDGDGLPWRFLHRSLREMLAAECLADEMSADERGRVIEELLAEKGSPKNAERPNDGPGRSGEVIALLAARLLDAERDGAHHEIDPVEPVRHLERLVKAAPDAAVRALASVERLDAWDHLRLLLSVPPPKDEAWRQVGWDNDQLDAVLDAIARGRGVERLWAAVDPGMSIFHLGVLWYALERVETWGSDARGWSAERREAAAQRFFAACGLSERTRPVIDAVALAGGTTWMGSPPEVGEERERPRHRVTIAPFALARFPVTTVQYRAFDRAKTGADDHPAAAVDWFSARLFAAWIGGRLPTEAEWEQACRAGSDTAWPFGDDPEALGDHAWFRGNSGHKTHPVGEKRANALGLNDMLGNVWEWCEDRFGPYDPASDRGGPPRGSARVLRGGSCRVDADGCRSAYRNRYPPDFRYGSIGFRVVLVPRVPSRR